MNKLDQLFRGRNLLIATKHSKEKVIAPVMSHHFGMHPVVPAGYNTDQFGTFSGEKPRVKSAFETVKMKLNQALDEHQESMGIASEGSFGPHPTLIMISANIELIFFVDRVNQIEIMAESISTDTNFDRQTISHWNDAADFATRSGFPQHGIIISLKNQQEEIIKIEKEIQNWQDFREKVDGFLAMYPEIVIETDMRAHKNPTRMNNIKNAVNNLVKKIKNTCPDCGFPGFDVIESISGLPCESCGTPTRLISATISGCKSCGFSRKESLADTYADPINCDFCNP